MNGDGTNDSFTSSGAVYIFVPDNSTGVMDHVHDAGSFILFPNPVVNGVVSIAFADLQGPVRMEVHDASGRMVYNQRIATPSLQGTPVDLSALAPGGYAVTITSAGHTSTARLIVSR